MTKLNEPETPPEGTQRSKESPSKSDKTPSTEQKSKFKFPKHVPNKHILKLYEDHSIADFPSTSLEAVQVIPHLTMMCNRLEKMSKDITESIPTIDDSLYDADNNNERVSMQIMQSKLS